MTFADAVRKAMTFRGMDAKTLSEASGVQPPYLSKLFSGKIKEPTWTKACAIIAGLEMSVDEFRDFQESE